MLTLPKKRGLGTECLQDRSGELRHLYASISLCSLLLGCRRQLTLDKLVSGKLLIPLTPDCQTALGRLPCGGGISGATVKNGNGGVDIGEFLCVAETRFGASVERVEFGDQFFIQFDAAAWIADSRLEIGLCPQCASGFRLWFNSRRRVNIGRRHQRERTIETVACIRISAETIEYRSGHRERLDFSTTRPDGIRCLLNDRDHLVAKREAAAGIRKLQGCGQT